MLATKDDLVKLTQPNNYRPNYHSRYTILSLIVSSLSLEYVQVLDIGGGSGYGFPYIKWACPNKRIKFNIVDLPTVCELGRKVLGNIDGLSYSNVPNLKCYDIVFFGASLQYFEDPIGVLDSWSVWSSSIIAIVDSPLSETKAFVTAQIDQGNRAIPSAIHNREELCEKFAEKGYDLIQKIFHSEHKEHFNNFDLPYSSAGYWTLIFRKRAA
jgi:putative methyltransferase (TIGR04325 family)